MSGVSYPQITARISGNTSGATANISTGTVVLAGGNNITLSQAGNSITISGPTQSAQPAIQSFSAGTTRATTGEVVLSNSNGISFGLNGNTVTASYTVPSVTNSSWTASDGATSLTIGQLAFTNSNGVTLSLSTTTGGKATLVASHNGLTSMSTAPGALAAGTQTATSGTIVFSNSNNVTFGMSGSTRITASASYSQSTAPGGFAAGTQTATSGTVVFSNSNGISFGMSNSSVVTASYTVPTQSVQTIGLYASSNTTGQSSSTTVDARTLTVRGAGVASVGYSAGELVISVPSGGGGGDGFNILAAGTQTAATNTSVKFADSNGISFGMSASSQITASYTVPTVTNSSWTASDAATSLTIGQLAFSQSNGLTLSLSTTTGGKATVVGSYTVPSTAGLLSNVNLSAGTTSNNLSRFVLSDSNGMAFGLNGSTVTASYTVPTVTNSSMTVSDNGTSGTLARLAFTNLNGVTLSLSTGAGGSHTIVGSHNALTSQSNQAFSAQGGSSAFQTLSFGNSNGLSFSNSNGSVVASYTVPTVTNSSMTVSDNGTSGTLARLAFTNLNGVTLSLSTGAGGSHTIVGSHNALTSQSNQAFSAQGGSSAFQTLSFGNSNGLSFSNSNGSVIASYTVPTVTSLTLSDAATSMTIGRLAFTNSNGLTLTLSTTTGGSATLVGSYTVPTQTNQSGGIYAVGNTTGQSSSSTYDARTLSIDGAGMVSVGWSNSTLRISATQTNQTLGIYGSSQTTGQSSSSTYDARSLTFRGAGIVSVGNSGGEVIISAVAAGAGDGVNILAAGTQTAGTNTSVKFADSNGISFGMSASSQITASYTVPTITSLTMSDAATSMTIGRLALTNSNGLTLSLSTAAGGSATIVGSYTVPTVTNSSWTVSDAATSLTIGQLAFSQSNGLTLSLSTTTGGKATVVGSYTVPSTAGLLSNVNLSAGTTSNNLSAFVLSNSNGLSFGLNGSTVTGSYTVPTVTNSTMSISDAGTSGTLARLAFTNLNGVTLSLSTGAGGSHTIVGSHNALTSQSNQAFSAAGGSSAFQTLSFSNANGATFSNNAGQVQLSYTVPTVTNSSWTVSDSVTSMTIGQLAFTGSNGLTLTLSTTTGGKATVIGSYTVPTQSNQTIGGYAVGNTTGQSSSSTFDARTLSFNGAGNVSVGYSGGSVVISGGTAAASPVNFSAGTTSNNLGTVVFSNSNGVSFGLNGSTITASCAAGGGGGIGAGVSTDGQTYGSTGTITTGNLVFVGGNGIWLSQSTGAAGSDATITFIGQGLSYCASQFPKQPVPLASSSAYSGSTTTTAGGSRTTFSYYISPFVIDDYVTFNAVYAPISMASTAGTYSQSFNHMYALYSKVGETLSTHMTFNMGMVWSQSSATAVTGNWWWGTNSTSNSSQTSGNVSASFVNKRNLILLYTGNSSLTPGHYWLAYAYSGKSTSSSVGQSGLFASYSQTTIGLLGTNITNPPYLMGIASTTYSTDSANQYYFPPTISTSAITGTGGSSQNRSNVIYFVSS